MEESKKDGAKDTASPQKIAEDNADEIQKQAIIDVERVNPDRYRDAIDLGQNQIKAVVCAIKNIVTQKKKRLQDIIDYHQANCNRLQQLYSTIQSYSALALNKENSILSFNRECSNKILKANEDINSKSVTLSACNEAINKYESETAKGLEEIKAKVEAIDKKKIDPILKTLKNESSTMAFFLLLTRLATGYFEATESEAMEFWKNVDSAKAKLLEFNYSAAKELNVPELESTLSKEESQLTDKDTDVKNLAKLCRLMIKITLDNTNLVKSKKEKANISLEIKRLNKEKDFYQSQRIVIKSINWQEGINSLSQEVKKNLDEQQAKLKLSTERYTKFESSFYANAPIINLTEGWTHGPNVVDAKPNNENADEPKNENIDKPQNENADKPKNESVEASKNKEPHEETKEDHSIADSHVSQDKVQETSEKH